MFEYLHLISFYSIFFISYIYLLLFIYEMNHPLTNFLTKYILSDIPILQISDDSTFHTVENKSCHKKYRISLFFIPFGEFKIYLITYYDKFELFKILSLNKVLEKLQEKEYKELNTTYDSIKEIENNLGEIKKKEEIEILKDDRNGYEKSIDREYIKGTFYITLLAGIISVIFTQIEKIFCLISENYNNLLFLIGFLFLSISFLNFLLISLFFMKVKSIKSYGFSGYKKKNSEYAYFYVNRCYEKLYSRYCFSYIRNIEDYFIKTILFSILLVLIYIIIHKF
jgi:hypothetical protein